MHLPLCPKVSVIELPYGYPADTPEQANPVFREPNVFRHRRNEESEQLSPPRSGALFASTGRR